MFLEYIHPLSSAVMLLKHLQCERVSFPCKERPGVAQPKTFKKECSHDTCARCKTFQQSSACILQCPELFNEKTTYKWRQYTNVVLDNGNQLRELKEMHGTVTDFTKVLHEMLVKYKQHYFT